MTNHVHLLLTPDRTDSLPRTMQSLGRRYVGYLNTKHRRPLPIDADQGAERLVLSASRIAERMNGMSANKAGIVLVVLFAGWHAIWCVLVLVGWAQPIIDFIFWLHFIKPVYVVEPFGIGRALGLIGLTAVLGYAVGACFAVLWGRLHR